MGAGFLTVTIEPPLTVRVKLGAAVFFCIP